MCYTCVMNKKGFSLLEIIISIAIVAVLSAIVVSSFHTAQLKKEQDGIAQELVASLDHQRTNSQAGKAGLRYGIKFNSSSYTLYSGNTYSITSPSNKVVTLPPGFSINQNLVNSDDVIYFTKIYGEANEDATFVVSQNDNLISPQNVILAKNGTVIVIE